MYWPLGLSQAVRSPCAMERFCRYGQIFPILTLMRQLYQLSYDYILQLIKNITLLRNTAA
jgi:hypothetical protein